MLSSSNQTPPPQPIAVETAGRDRTDIHVDYRGKSDSKIILKRNHHAPDRNHSRNDESAAAKETAYSNSIDVDRVASDSVITVKKKLSSALRDHLTTLGEGDRRSNKLNFAVPREVELERERSFTYSLGLSTEKATALLKVYGKNELPEKVIPKWYIFLSQLWQPMPIMIWLAAIVEAGIQNYIDMAILLVIQFANASIGYYEITKAGDAVAALKKSLKPIATVKRDGSFANIDATLLVPGDLVLLAAGSAVPADCRVNQGEIEVDESSLTGESLPVAMFQGSQCKMGSTVARGEVEATVEATGAKTFFGKTAALLGVSVKPIWYFFKLSLY